LAQRDEYKAEGSCVDADGAASEGGSPQIIGS
jgi:hypothetical protein